MARCIGVDRLQPKVLDGDASEDGAEDRPAGVRADEGDEDVAGLAEARLRENAQVLQENGKFGEVKSEVVDPDRCPEPDIRVESLVLCKCRTVASRAVFNCGRLAT